jgi:hypothetical protein
VRREDLRSDLETEAVKKRTERRPAKISGWREDAVRTSAVTKHMAKAFSWSVWLRRGVMVISTLEFTEATDGHGESIWQWNITVSRKAERPSDDEVKQALACFGMSAAVESGGGGSARHFWLTVDPARRPEAST